MRIQKYFQLAVAPHSYPLQEYTEEQLASRDHWCRTPSLPYWNGQDFSRCARLKFLIGEPALVLILLLVGSFIVPCLPHLWLRIRRGTTGGSWIKRRSASYSPISPQVARKDSDLNGPQAVSHAEDQIIAAEVMREGGLGIDEQHRKELTLDHNLFCSPSTNQDSCADPPSYFTALVRSWKEFFITVCTVGLLVIAFARHLISSYVGESSNWLLLPIILWMCVSIVSTLKLFMQVQAVIRNKPHPDPKYFQLEYRTVPIYLISLPLELLDTRSIWLQHFSRQATAEATGELLAMRLLTLVLLIITNVLELGTSRPTTLLPGLLNHSSSTMAPANLESDVKKRPGPLEPGRSLLSLAYFIHTDSYLWRHKSSTATEESIPDVRVDDKSAAVLFRWKRDQAEYEAENINPSFLRALSWHFRHILLSQQLFAYFNAFGALLPPFFLQRIIGFISSRTGENPEPVHVALLYAFGMLGTQVFLAFSQSASLMIGRRLSVRLRALLITLIFTKSLRRTGVNAKVSEVVDSSDDGSSTSSKSATKEDSEGSASTGKIANLVSNDVASLSEIGAYLHFLWPESAIQIILAGIYLYVLLGYSALAGMFCIVIAVPIQSYLTALWARYQDLLMAAADKRLGLATEVINNIKVVKFFAWESNFLQKMQVLREAELAMLFKRLLVTIGESTVSFSVPIFVSIVTFYTHTKVLGKSLTPEEAFTALALFNVFRFPLSVLVGMISGLLQSYVSLKRIEKFLNEKETEKYSTLSVPRAEAGDPVVGFRDATFTYDAKQEDSEPAVESSTFKLSVDFAFPEGKLSLIIGRVGSGKGTLLLSLLGETTKLSGEAFLPSPVSRVWGLDPDEGLTDTTAYCPQQAWLLSDSIRNNILYGSLMNRARYSQVLKACALVSDLKTFSDGDLTEIGDKGTVLSGGQKARISLARALYSPAKVLLLDDVLSAVDSHTAQHLFNHVLNGPLMKDRTCILVTHAVDLCMPAASFVVSLDRGQVVFAGEPSSYKLVSALGTLSEDNEIHGNKKTTEAGTEVTIENLAAPVLNEEDAIVEIKTRATQRLVEEERQAVGAVSLATYRLYYDCLGGFMPIFNSCILFILAELGNVLSTWVLKQWAESNQPSSGPASPNVSSWLTPSTLTSTKLSSTGPSLLYFHEDHSSEKDRSKQKRLDHYILLYLLTGMFALAFELIRETYFTCRSIIAGRKIYERLISTLLNAQVRFFDTVPMGRVLNRLSTDVRTVDRELADALIYLAERFLSTLAILVVVVAVLPMGFLVSTMGACLIYVALGYLYLASTREIKRSESTSRSPVISLCTECLGGVTSIRAYGDIGRYTQQMFKLIDAYNRPFFMLWMCNRWLSCRIDTAAALFTFLVVIYMIQSGMPAALSGFALSYVITLNTKTLWIVRWWSVNEINFNSMERIHEYLGVQQEPRDGIRPPAAWPSKEGTIEVEGLTARYAPHLPPVLKSVSFSVKAGEKIGICGRTGSGKSTLALSFFRFIEAEAGRIFIDGLDISKLDLASLRSRLTIIPQESVLFSATIRWNLDPFSEHDDGRIWDALRRVGMAAPFELSPSNSSAGDPSFKNSSAGQDLQFITSLDMEVKEGGKNFSTGQRQLLAIARAILKLENSALLILDESTASLDAESDEKIQATIRSEMGDSTILCIAHRLKTIIDYDKVLVLSDGEVLEFDEPWKLLLDDQDGDQEAGPTRPPSAFKELCLKSGHYDELKQSALEAKKLRSPSH